MAAARPGPRVAVAVAGATGATVACWVRAVGLATAATAARRARAAARRARAAAPPARAAVRRARAAVRRARAAVQAARPARRGRARRGAAACGGGGGAGGSGLLGCPANLPANGSVCVREGSICYFGNDPRGDQCNTKATCTLLKWVVTPPNPATCPPNP